MVTLPHRRKAFRARPSSGGGDTDPYFANVVLLMHCEGTDASTTFTDSSNSGHTFSVFGNSQIDTAQKKYGSSSALFDGNGDYLSTASSSDFTFGTGDYTVEFWVLFNGTPSSVMTFLGNYSAGWAFQFRSDHSNQLTLYDGSGFVIYSGTNNFSDGLWHHLAVCRSGTSLRIFIDGTQSGSTVTNSTNMSGTGVMYVAELGGIGFFLNGWMDEIRITKGVARYTSNFTPPTAAFPNS